jgi:hypothetical protein
MNTLRKLVICTILMQVIIAASSGSAAWAQPKDVYEATDEMRRLGLLETLNVQGTNFSNENNNLAIDPNLFCINDSDDSVWIAALLRDGDYTKWWRGGAQTSKRYNWVFIPEDFMRVCANKVVTDITCQQGRSTRLCKLLGLDTNKRDTIVYMKVLKKQLFRPAYNTDIATSVTARHRGSGAGINAGNKSIKEWMIEQQATNTYPWTRMGYTFDWGARNFGTWSTGHDYIGVTEFIVKPESPISTPHYVTIDSIDTQKSWCNVSKQK